MPYFDVKMRNFDLVPPSIKRTWSLLALLWFGLLSADMYINMRSAGVKSPTLALVAALDGLLVSGGFAWIALLSVVSDLRDGVTLRRDFKHSYFSGSNMITRVYEIKPCLRSNEPLRFHWEVLKFSLAAILMACTFFFLPACVGVREVRQCLVLVGWKRIISVTFLILVGCCVAGLIRRLTSLQRTRP